MEYNQLDPILRATISPEGDVNDPETGLSPFPGNINNIVFKLDTYLKVCLALVLAFTVCLDLIRVFDCTGITGICI